MVVLIILMTFFMPVNTEECMELNKENVRATIISEGILFPDIVLRQSILETGWFKSYNARKRNQIFGFRSSKWATEDNPRGFKVHDCWIDCVKYYKSWQDKRYKGGDYYQFLTDVGYATDWTYVEKLKKIKI